MSLQKGEVNRVVWASFLGTMIEWYDFFLYGTAAALVFNRLFFPQFDPSAGTIAAFATYAVGFFARPLGGVIFGHFGDLLGRKSMLVTTLMLMGVATVLMGMLPTYEQVGIWAAVLLVLLRFIQGIGVGGEWGGAVLMAVEHGDAAGRGFRASWVQAGVPVGLLLANGVFACVSQMEEKAFLSWGWRVPFLCGAVLLMVGMFIRLKVLESPLFTEVKDEQVPVKVPLFAVLREHPKEVLYAMGARLAENAYFYILTVLVLSYGTQQLQMPREVLLNAVFIGSALQLVAIPFFGALSDQCGRKPVYLGGAVFLLFYALPFFWMLETRVEWVIYAAVGLGLVGHAAMYGPQAAFFSELFGTRVRYTGASLGYQLASPLAGGLAPLVAAWLLRVWDGQALPVALYLMVLCLLTLLSVLLAQETRHKRL